MRFFWSIILPGAIGSAFLLAFSSIWWIPKLNKAIEEEQNHEKSQA